MDDCLLCHLHIDGPSLAHADGALHPACVAERLPADALAAVAGVLLLVLVPALAVWSG